MPKERRDPKEGRWFKVGDALVHRCCGCPAVHKFEFGIGYPDEKRPRWGFVLDGNLDTLFVRIRRVDK